MSRNRFEQLLIMLHFNDNEAADNQDQEIDCLTTKKLKKKTQKSYSLEINLGL
jgi:hypothetical protein